MANKGRGIKLDDVLDAFVAEVDLPLATSLTEWIQKYPQYTKELTEFAVAWSLMEFIPTYGSTDSDDETLTQNDIVFISDLLKKTRNEYSSVESERNPITSLMIEGRIVGFSIDEFADKVELSAALARKLDRHLIQYITIPLRVIESFAHVLKREVVSIARYLSLPPNFVSSASYKADQPPSMLPQENFFDAVRDDLELTEERRARWLAFEHKEK